MTREEQNQAILDATHTLSKARRMLSGQDEQAIRVQEQYEKMLAELEELKKKES